MLATGIRARIVWRETLRALLVLALVALSFAHAPAFAVGTAFDSAESWCGDPLLPEGQPHVPCHACRLGDGAALPPAPITTAPVCFTAATIVHVSPAEVVIALDSLRLPQPRGPPALV